MALFDDLRGKSPTESQKYQEEQLKQANNERIRQARGPINQQRWQDQQNSERQAKAAQERQQKQNPSLKERGKKVWDYAKEQREAKRQELKKPRKPWKPVEHVYQQDGKDQSVFAQVFRDVGQRQTEKRNVKNQAKYQAKLANYNKKLKAFEQQKAEKQQQKAQLKADKKEQKQSAKAEKQALRASPNTSQKQNTRPQQPLRSKESQNLKASNQNQEQDQTHKHKQKR